MPALRNSGRPHKCEVHRRQSKNPPSKCEGGAPGYKPDAGLKPGATLKPKRTGRMPVPLQTRAPAALTFAGGRRTDGSEAISPLLQGQLK